LRQPVADIRNECQTQTRDTPPYKNAQRACEGAHTM
jgi:hypothetical protein